MGAAADVWDHDKNPWIAPEKETVREAVLAGVLYFGVCFGAQPAFGARSYRGMEAELGLNQVFLTAAARRVVTKCLQTLAFGALPTVGLRPASPRSVPS